MKLQTIRKWMGKAVLVVILLLHQLPLIVVVWMIILGIRLIIIKVIIIKSPLGGSDTFAPIFERGSIWMWRFKTLALEKAGPFEFRLTEHSTGLSYCLHTYNNSLLLKQLLPLRWTFSFSRHTRNAGCSCPHKLSLIYYYYTRITRGYILYNGLIHISPIYIYMYQPMVIS